MEQVENFCKDHVKTGEWMKLDDDQETILALKAIINKGEMSERKKSKKDTKKKFKTGRQENKEKP